jgi:hypothetical protein
MRGTALGGRGPPLCHCSVPLGWRVTPELLCTHCSSPNPSPSCVSRPPWSALSRGLMRLAPRLRVFGAPCVRLARPAVRHPYTENPGPQTLSEVA